MLGGFLALANAFMKAFIDPHELGIAQPRVDLEHRLLERQVGVGKVLFELGLERLGVGRERGFSNHDLVEPPPFAGLEDRWASVRSEAGRASEGLSLGASAVIAVAGCAGSRFITNCPSDGAGW